MNRALLPFSFFSTPGGIADETGELAEPHMVPDPSTGGVLQRERGGGGVQPALLFFFFEPSEPLFFLLLL